MKTGPLAGILFLLLIAPVQAQWHGGHNPHGGFHSEWRPHAPGGSLGGFFGGIVGGAIVDLLRPPPVIVQPQMPPPEAYAITPYTPQWYQYCSNKYRSFNPQTGLYLGYDGRFYPCQ